MQPFLVSVYKFPSGSDRYIRCRAGFSFFGCQLLWVAQRERRGKVAAKKKRSKSSKKDSAPRIIFFS